MTFKGKFCLFAALSYVAISQSTFAQTFLESIKANDDFKPISQVIREIKLHALKDHSYLSLGESHNESKTSIPLNYVLANAYLESRERDVVFCGENIPSFFQSLQGTEILNRSALKKIFDNNGLSRTDFVQCKDQNNHYLTYSGFFHQYPFARSFMNEFGNHPVITDKGNNIYEQMGDQNGLFISQIEFDYLESRASLVLLNSQLTMPLAFKLKAKQLQKHVNEIKEQLKVIVRGNTSATTKLGLFVSKSNFERDDLIMPTNSYFLLTELESRIIENHGFEILKGLTEMRDSQLKRVLNLMAESSVYLTKGAAEPLENGKYPSMTYGTLPGEFNGRSEFLSIKHDQDIFVIVAEPSNSNLKCFHQTPNSTIEINCYSQI
jgi:hypothetical protein